MFNYVKETIINDLSRVLVLTKKGEVSEQGKGETLVVKRGGNYKFADICNGKVYETDGIVGEPGIITINTSSFTASGVDFRQLAIFIGSSEKLSDFALANWSEFGKPILIETCATDAASLKTALDLALPNDNPLYKTEVSGNNVAITLAESWMVPVECKIFEHSEEDDKLTELTGAVTIVKNVPEFATGKWLVENLRFPSQPNLRYNALYSDEAPVRGTVYTQFAFRYKVEHAVPGGLSAVGQDITSITTHVFYVPTADADTFANYFEENGCEIVTESDSDSD